MSWLMLEELDAMPFKHFEDLCALDVLASAQEMADLGYGALQPVKACGRLGESI
jgi:hypothetical protein